MRKTILTTLIFGALSVTASSAHTIAISSVTGAQDSAGNNIGSYQGQYDSINYTINCDDLDHNIGIGATATPVNLSTIADLSLTRWGGGKTGAALATVTMKYEEIFYLSTMLNASYTAPSTFYNGKLSSSLASSANTTVNADIQDAMWSYFATSPVAPNASSNAVGYWLDQASSKYILPTGHPDYNSYLILTDSANQFGGVQELFIVNRTPDSPQTPEPGTMGMLFGGVAMLTWGGIRRRMGRASRATVN